MSKTVSGELITIDDSAYDGMDDIVIYGKTVQNLWFNPSGKSISSNPDGSLKISVTNGNVEAARFMSYALKPSTKYTASVDKSLGTPTSYALNVGFRNSGGQVIANVYFGQDGSYATKRTFTSPASFAYAVFEVVVLADLSGTYRVMLREATEAEIKAAASTPQTLPVYPDDSGPDASNEELGIIPLDEVSTLADSDFDDYWCPPGISSIDNVEIVTARKNLFKDTATGTTKGITCERVSDGGFRLYGTSTARAQFGSSNYNLPSGKYTFYNGIGDASASSCVAFVRINRENGELDYVDPYSTGTKTFEISSNDSIAAIVEVRGIGYTVDETLYPYIVPYGEDGGFEIPFVANVSIDLQGYSLCSLPDGTRDELRIDKEYNVTLIQRVANASFTADDLVGNNIEYAETHIGNASQGYVYSSGVLGNPNSGDTINDFALNDNPDDVQGMVKCWVFSLETNKIPTGNVTAHLGNGKTENSNTEQLNSLKSIIGDRTIHVLYKLYNPKTISLGKIDLPKLRKKPLVNNVWANGSAETTGFYLDTEMQLTYRQWPGVRADGFKVSGKHNFWDFASCVASSDSGKPEKKFVTATVPYMSGFYDLSKIYGAIAYESRDVSYTFELLGDDMDDLQRQKTNLLDWLGLVHDEPIYDDTQPNYHYIGSFYEADWEEDETGESGTLTVTFKCQPFLIADRATEESLSVGTHTVVNHGQQVSVFAKANSGSATVKINGVIQAVTTTEQRLTAQLQPGENEVVVTSNSVTLRYFERHL